jgi:hypothetical protein
MVGNLDVDSSYPGFEVDSKGLVVRYCYGAETLKGNFLRCTENLRVMMVFCSGTFWYTQQLNFDSRFRLFISHGTDTIMTQYDCCNVKEIDGGRICSSPWVRLPIPWVRSWGASPTIYSRLFRK